MKLTFVSVAFWVLIAAVQANLVWGASAPSTPPKAAANVPAKPAAPPKPTVDLTCNRQPNQTSHVELTLEVGGELKVNRDIENKVIPVKMNVNGHMVYDERLLQMANNGEKLSKSVRYYENADAVLNLGTTTLTPSLRPNYHLIVDQGNDASATLFSPVGPLTREELDLISMPANTLMIDRLLPGKPVAIGDTWKHSEAVSATLLGLDKVFNTTLESKLVSSADGVARVEIAGTVKGSFGGSQTQIEVKGRYQISLGSIKQVTWAGLLIKENRQPGEASAGVNVTALLQMTIAPASIPPNLTDEALTGVPLTPTDALTRLTHRAADNLWAMNYSRNWYLNNDQRDMTVLRLIDDGLRKAQCNIKTMPKLRSAKDASLAKFEKEVRAALAKNAGKFVESKELHLDAGYRVFQVVMTGEVSKLPIQWNYYLVIDNQGDQVVFAFTAAKDDVTVMSSNDQQLVNAFRFTDPTMTANPTDGFNPPR